MNAVSIRLGRISDIPAIIGIVNSTRNRAGYGWVRKVVLEHAINEFATKRRFSKDVLEVATCDGRVIGFFRIYHRDDGATRLHEIGVVENMQGSGVGSRLIKKAMGLSRARKQNLFRVLTPDKLRSNDFYRKHGLVRVGTMQNKKKTKILNIYEFSL